MTARTLSPDELAALEADLRDRRMAELMANVVTFALEGSDGQAGMKAVLREIEQLQPGILEGMAARIQLARAGLPTTVQ